MWWTGYTFKSIIKHSPAESHPTSLFNLNERLYEKKVDPLPEPRADSSSHACSDCLALTELVRLGEPVFTAISRKVVG